MRIDADPKSPDYDAEAVNSARIFLNGSERHSVIFADEGKRMAKQFRLDERGKVAIDPRTHQPIIDSFFGDVRIEVPDEIRRRLDKAAQSA